MVARLSALVLLLSGCAYQPEIQVLAGPRKVDMGATEGALTIQVLQRIGHSRWHCGWTHNSVINKGEPFHPEREEITFDQLPGCGPRFGGKERAVR